MTTLALGLFDDLAAAGLHERDLAERELLWAACTLHDVGMTIDYDDHHKHSRYLILNGALPGFDPRELVLISEIVRYHRKGMPSFSAELAPVVRKGDQGILERGATLLRLAEGIERARDQIVTDVSVTAAADDDAVTLVLHADADVPRRTLGGRARARPVQARLRPRAADPRVGAGLAIREISRKRPGPSSPPPPPAGSTGIRKRPPPPSPPPPSSQLAGVVAVAEDAEVAGDAAVGVDLDPGQDLLALFEAQALHVEVGIPIP